MTWFGAITRRAGAGAISAALMLCALQPGSAAAEETLSVGVLAYGTVNWELDVIKRHGLDTKHGVDVEVVPLANKDATSIALQSRAVDMIVTDWLWVSRQRDAGADYTFVPYSTAAGALTVHGDSDVHSLADLDGARVGVAGGALDKSWLLLRAYSKKTIGEDLADMVDPAYAAPPLLNEKFTQGELDAVLNYWNYTARLKAAGHRAIITVQELLPELGVSGKLPLIGYVFRESFAADHEDAVAGFIAASKEASSIMATSDEEWEELRSMTGAKDDETLLALRDAYREGIIEDYGPEQAEAIRQAFAIVAEWGGRDLVGNATELAPGTLWTGAF